MCIYKFACILFVFLFFIYSNPVVISCPYVVLCTLIIIVIIIYVTIIIIKVRTHINLAYSRECVLVNITT